MILDPVCYNMGLCCQTVGNQPSYLENNRRESYNPKRELGNYYHVFISLQLSMANYHHNHKHKNERKELIRSRFMKNIGASASVSVAELTFVYNTVSG